MRTEDDIKAAIQSAEKLLLRIAEAQKDSENDLDPSVIEEKKTQEKIKETLEWILTDIDPLNQLFLDAHRKVAKTLQPAFIGRILCTGIFQQATKTGFQDTKLSKLYEYIKEMAGSGLQIDIVTVSEYIINKDETFFKELGGRTFINELALNATEFYEWLYGKKD